MQLSSLIGKKTYQKQGFLQDGTRVPLSGVVVAGNFVTQLKTEGKEGYNSVQLGFDTKRKNRKSIVNHGKKAGLEKTPRFFREIRLEDLEEIALGSEVNIAEVFAPGDIVDVTGVSKGKGFAGGVKRYHFKGGPRTHGQSDRERAPGSIGQTTTPGRVYKGKRMAGRMGQETVTVKNLEVIDITDDGVMLIKGLVPGSLNSYVVVKKVGANKKFVPLYKEEIEAPVEEKTESGDTDQTHPSDDVQQPSEEATSEPTSLSENQSTESEVNTKSEEGLVSDSPQDGSVSVAEETPVKDEKLSEAKSASGGEGDSSIAEATEDKK